MFYEESVTEFLQVAVEIHIHLLTGSLAILKNAVSKSTMYHDLHHLVFIIHLD